MMWKHKTAPAPYFIFFALESEVLFKYMNIVTCIVMLC